MQYKTDWMNKEQKNKTQDLCRTNMNVMFTSDKVLYCLRFVAVLVMSTFN